MQHNGDGPRDTEDAPQDAKHVQLLFKEDVSQNGAAGQYDDMIQDHMNGREASWWLDKLLRKDRGMFLRSALIRKLDITNNILHSTADVLQTVLQQSRSHIKAPG